MVDDKERPTATSDPTPWERFVSLGRKVAQTPKAEVDRRDKAWHEERKAQSKASRQKPQAE